MKVEKPKAQILRMKVEKPQAQILSKVGIFSSVQVLI
jgi:hypothetical protein